MARPLRIEYPGAFYHVTSRGNERKPVFKSQRDREKFLAYLESATERYDASVHVYCLMDNHYHLLLETPAGNLSQIMQHINGAYTTYFNVKRQRSGHLFQGRFKAILLEADEYAKELSRYIHLNPVRAGIVALPEEYPWSSCRHYTVDNAAPGWLQRSFIFGYFGNNVAVSMRRYREFMHALMDRDYVSPLTELKQPAILGSSQFVSEIRDRFFKNRAPDRDVSGLRALLKKPTIDQIKAAVDSAMPTEPRLARQVALHLCHRWSGMKLLEIGLHYGVSPSAVTQASGRIELRSRKSKNLRKLLQRMEKMITV